MPLTIRDLSEPVWYWCMWGITSEKVLCCKLGFISKNCDGKFSASILKKKLNKTCFGICSNVHEFCMIFCKSTALLAGSRGVFKCPYNPASGVLNFWLPAEGWLKIWREIIMFLTENQLGSRKSRVLICNINTPLAKSHNSMYIHLCCQIIMYCSQLRNSVCGDL